MHAFAEHFGDTPCFQPGAEQQPQLLCRTLPDGTLTYANSAFCRFFGQPADRLIGTNAVHIWGNHVWANLQQCLNSLSPNSPSCSHEVKVIRPDGSVAWLDWVSLASFDRQNQCVDIQGVGRDITNQYYRNQIFALQSCLLQQAVEEKPLRQIAWETCRRLVELFALAALFIGIRPAGQEDTLLAADGLEKRLVAWLTAPGRDWFAGKTIWGKTVRAGLPQVMSPDDPVWADTLGPGIGSGYFALAWPLDCGNSIQGVVTVYSDRQDLIHACKQHVAVIVDQLVLAIKNRRCQKQTRFFHAAITAAKNGITITDKTGITQWANPAFCGMTGYDANELATFEGMSRLVPGELRNELHQDLLHGLKTKNSWEGEFPIVCKDGSRAYIESSVTPVYDPKNDIAGYIAISKNITERKAMELALYNAKEATAKAEKLSFLAIMAGSIIHEISQPLNAIKIIADGYRYLADIGKPQNREKAVEYFSKITAQTDRIERIISHMRSFLQSREHAAARLCCVNDAVRHALELVGAQLSAHAVIVTLSLSDEPLMIMGNPIRLEETIINLLINAQQALDEAQPVSKHIDIITRKKAGQAVLEIMDNGPGIPEHDLHNVFDPFFTTKTGGIGMGLGLSIVQTAVHSMRGQVCVKNRPEGGARFCLTLPLANPCQTFV